MNNKDKIILCNALLLLTIGFSLFTKWVPIEFIGGISVGTGLLSIVEVISGNKREHNE